MTREQHRAKIYVVGSRRVASRTVLVMLCSGPDCGGAEILSRLTVDDVLAQADAHIDGMAALTA